MQSISICLIEFTGSKRCLLTAECRNVIMFLVKNSLLMDCVLFDVDYSNYDAFILRLSSHFDK